MDEIKQGTIFWFGNQQKGIVIRLVDEAKSLYEIIYHQNGLKYVKQDAYFRDGMWELSNEWGRVLRESEFPHLIEALHK